MPLPRTSFVDYPDGDNPFQASAAKSHSTSKSSPAQDGPRISSPAYTSPLTSPQRSSTMDRGQIFTLASSPPPLSSSSSASSSLAEATASLSFADKPPLGKPVYRSPSIQSELSQQSAALEETRAKLNDLKAQNELLQTMLDDRLNNETEFERVVRTQRPTSPPQDPRQRTFLNERKLLQSIEALKVTKEEKRKLRKEADDLKAQLSARDAAVETLRSALSASEEKNTKLEDQLNERNLRSAEVEQQLKTEMQALREERNYWEAQALQYSKEGQKCWNELQQQATTLKSTQMTLDYERNIMRSTEQTLKDIRSQHEALERKKKAAEQKLAWSRGDTERIHKEAQELRASLAESTSKISMLEEDKQTLQKEVAKAEELATSKASVPDAVEASRRALAAQKAKKPLEALFLWAGVAALVSDRGMDAKLRTTSTYNRASLLLDLTWQTIEKERLIWAQKDCTALLQAQPEYYKAHRLQARVHTQSKAYDLAIFSFKTAIRYATAAGDSNVHWIKATEAEAKKVKDLRDFESQAEERARERQMEQEFDAFVKGKYSDWQILGLQKPFANSPIDIKNAAKTLANRYHPDKPNGNTKIMQRVFQARDNLLKRTSATF